MIHLFKRSSRFLKRPWKSSEVRRPSILATSQHPECPPNRHGSKCFQWFLQLWQHRQVKPIRASGRTFFHVKNSKRRANTCVLSWRKPSNHLRPIRASHELRTIALLITELGHNAFDRHTQTFCMRFQEHLTSSSYVHARPALKMAQPSRTHYTSCHCRHTRVLIFGGSREKTQMTTRLLFFTSHIFRRHDTVYNVDFKNFEIQVYSWTSAKTYGVRFYGSDLKRLIEIQRELVATPTPRIWVMSILHRIL